jgi:hypothetical protein
MQAKWLLFAFVVAALLRVPVQAVALGMRIFLSPRTDTTLSALMSVTPGAVVQHDSDVIMAVVALNTPSDRKLTDLSIDWNSIRFMSANANVTYTQLAPYIRGGKARDVGICAEVPGCDYFVLETRQLFAFLPSTTGAIKLELSAVAVSTFIEVGKAKAAPVALEATQNFATHGNFQHGTYWAANEAIAFSFIGVLFVAFFIFLIFAAAADEQLLHDEHYYHHHHHHHHPSEQKRVQRVRKTDEL